MQILFLTNFPDPGHILLWSAYTISVLFSWHCWALEISPGLELRAGFGVRQ